MTLHRGYFDSRLELLGLVLWLGTRERERENEISESRGILKSERSTIGITKRVAGIHGECLGCSLFEMVKFKRADGDEWRAPGRVTLIHVTRVHRGI